MTSYFLNLFLASGSLLQADVLTICGEVSPGEMERKKVNATLLSVKDKRSYNSFTDNERFLIRNCASVYGPTKAVRKFKKTHPYLKQRSRHCYRKSFD